MKHVSSTLSDYRVSGLLVVRNDWLYHGLLASSGITVIVPAVDEPMPLHLITRVKSGHLQKAIGGT